MTRVLVVVGGMAVLAILLGILYRTVRTENMRQQTDLQRVEKTVHEGAKPDHLVVLWTSGDPEVALNMVLMYTYNARKQGWWKDVTLIIWGPSQKLVLANNDVKDQLKRMQQIGVRIEACKACSDRYGISDELTGYSVDVKYMGEALTDYIRNAHVITF